MALFIIITTGPQFTNQFCSTHLFASITVIWHHSGTLWWEIGNCCRWTNASKTSRTLLFACLSPHHQIADCHLRKNVALTAVWMFTHTCCTTYTAKELYKELRGMQNRVEQGGGPHVSTSKKDHHSRRYISGCDCCLLKAKDKTITSTCHHRTDYQNRPVSSDETLQADITS